MSVRRENPGETLEIGESGRDAPATLVLPGPEPVPEENASASTADGATRAPGGRLPALDVLRGIAILGTFLANIWIFAAAVPEFAVEEPTGLNSVITTGKMLLTDGKFIGLLTIMFGIGLEIQRQSALRKGQTWPGMYPWRAALLILDGLLNYLFVFEFDVLMGYGLTALVVAAVMARGPRAQRIWMYAALGVHVVVAAVSVPLMAWLMPPREEMLAEGGLVADQLTPHASYWGDVVFRLQHFLMGRLEIPIMFLMGLGMFLVGAHLYRAGIFGPAGAKLRRRVMLLGLGVGLPLDWGLRLLVPEQTSYLTRYITSSVIAFGILAAVAAFYAGGRVPGVTGRLLSLVGRMALTCYILQNVLATVIFYDYGLGLGRRIHGEWSGVWTLVVYVVASGVLIAFCALWLRWFRRGPVEIVWHASFEWLAGRRGEHLRRRRARKAPAVEPAAAHE